MNTYHVIINKDLSSQVEADYFDIRDDKLVVFYKDDDRDNNPSGIEIVAMFDSPISAAKMVTNNE